MGQVKSRAVAGVLATAMMLIAGACVETPTDPPVLETPNHFQIQEIYSGLKLPTAVAFSESGQVFISEKSGKIKAFDSVDDISPTTVIDLSPVVYDHADRGLLGMTIDPLFNDTRPYLYAIYSYDPPLFGDMASTFDACGLPQNDGCVIKSELVKIEVNPATLEAVGSPTVLGDNWCHQFPGHAIADVRVGGDGALYASGGDGANFTGVDYGQHTGGTLRNPCDDPPTGNGTLPTPPTARGGALRAQSAAVPTPGFNASFSGAVIKVDPDTGDAWPTNPYAGDADPERAKIVGYGFRNPFRLAARPGTDQLWVSEVGWNKFEEVNLIEPGTDAPNFGWPCMEGPNPQAAYEAVGLDACQRLYDDRSLLTEPYFTYPRRPTIVEDDKCVAGGQSASGLAFYEGGSYPSRYDGGLMYTDYGLGCTWWFPIGANGNPDFGNGELMVRGFMAVDLELGPGGDVFMLEHAKGKLVRLVYDENTFPFAEITASATQGGVPLTVQLNASASYDLDPGDTLSFAWDLNGDDIFDDATGEYAEVTYTTEGVKTVGLRVTDSYGGVATDTITIEVGSQFPVLTMETPLGTNLWSSGDALGFNGSAVDEQDGLLPASAISWEANIHHCVSDAPGDCHVHPLSSWDGVDSGSFVAPDHEYPSYVEVVMTATDSDGNSATVRRDVHPEAVVVSVTSSPAGASVTVGERTVVTPAQVTLIRNSQTSVLTAENQTIGGASYTFDAWSDGGAILHEITPTEDAVLSVNFTATP